MLRTIVPVSVYVCHILESSVLSVVESRKPFGILTTGPYWKEPLTEATRRITPDNVHGLFAGVWCSGVGVLQLGSEEQEHDRQIERCAVEMVKKGVQIIILGCAGTPRYSSTQLL
jgi:Asp/Glu/hydantoin racemase